MFTYHSLFNIQPATYSLFQTIVYCSTNQVHLGVCNLYTLQLCQFDWKWVMENKHALTHTQYKVCEQVVLYAGT